MNEKQLLFWQQYVESINNEVDDFYVEAAMAGDESITDKLLELYLSGKKTAGTGLVKDYYAHDEDIPHVGNHWIILDSKEIPRCIVKTVSVELHRFGDVPERIAIAEGEGDLSIEYWKKEHKRFFTPFLEDLDITNLENEEVVTEFFELVYKA